ncbi:ADP-ribosylglycohydrolase family protein [Bacillus sp. IITD106]|nr:ADP-ribosylglycohydrolase family protein [Bacillus sp. IITD106]
MFKYYKTLGGILGAAVGDAMGAPTEMKTTEQIIERFGGYVKNFIAPPEDTFARNNLPGQITDDFSLAFFIMKAIIRHNGEINDEVAKEGIIDWSNHEEYFEPFAGPTTRAAIMEMKGEKLISTEPLVNYNAQATNGSAMKIFPVGLVNPDNVDEAINDAITITLPTHNNHLAISGACAVAAAVSKAMADDANVYNVIQAGLYGAKEGEKLGKEVGITVAGPSVVKRMELAIEIALKSNSMENAMKELADIIGSGIHISESVPAAFGLFLAANGDTMESIYGGVNIGNDTDTVASMAGAIAGTLNGYQSFPDGYLNEINEKNNMDLSYIAKSLLSLVKG